MIPSDISPISSITLVSERQWNEDLSFKLGGTWVYRKPAANAPPFIIIHTLSAEGLYRQHSWLVDCPLFSQAAAASIWYLWISADDILLKGRTESQMRLTPGRSL